MAAGADIQQAGLSTGAEAFIGRVISPIGEHGFGCNKSIQRDTFKLARTLVNKLQRSVSGKGKNKVKRVCKSANISLREKSVKETPESYLQASGL